MSIKSAQTKVSNIASLNSHSPLEAAITYSKRFDGGTAKRIEKGACYKVVTPRSDLDYGYEGCTGILLGVQEGTNQHLLFIPLRANAYSLISFDASAIIMVD